MALQLSVPISKRSLPKEIHTNPRKARAWVETLPLTRPTEAAQLLAQNLEALNRAKLEPDDRVAVVETYRTIMAVILDELEAIYTTAVLPLTPKAREAAEAGLFLLTECAFTYKMSVLVKTGKLIVFNAKKNIAPVLLRAMQHLRALAVLSYKTYRQPPAGLWHEMHQLFRYAAGRNLDAIRVEEATKDTIRDVYLELVMLAIADPYRLTQKEMGQTQEILFQNRGLVDLHGEAGAGDMQRHFLIALDSDNAPKPPQHPASVNATGVWLLVDPARLIERLGQRLKAGGSPSRTKHDVSDLTTRLMRLWGDPPKRQFHRHPTDTLATLCSGVKAIAHFAEIAKFKRAERAKKGVSEHQTRPMQTVPPTQTQQMDTTTKTLVTDDWEVLNQSTNGLRLRRSANGKISVCVGEAVGVLIIGSHEWQAGVVRWLALFDQDAMEFGVELMASSVRHVTIEPPVNVTVVRLTPAVLLGPGGLEGELDLLLTPADTYVPAREFVYNDGKRTTHARATTLVERTARFDLFQTEST